MVTTNQKPIINTQKLDRKEHKLTINENHQTTREEAKRRRNEQRRTTITTGKQVKTGNQNISLNNRFNSQWTKYTNQ